MWCCPRTCSTINPTTAGGRAMSIWARSSIQKLAGTKLPARAKLTLLLGLALGAALLGLGEETARSLGLNVALIRFLLIVTACVLAGSAVSFSGLLSFVGLLAPHMVRRLLGEAATGHRALLPAAALLGAGFVALCDLLSRVLFAPFEIPVGILLSLVGGPFFLFLILRQRGRGR
ncbi:MAG: iron ABC transporter permease [Acutalibacter sp.]|nr:iron ABC transporter permease [Acutalibacter sp.]